MNHVSPDLLDIVEYFNAAARLGRDGVLWAGWNATQWNDNKKARGTSPAAGAQMVCVSTKGARFLVPKRHEIPNMHMGNFLSKYCGHRWQNELGAAYLQPPIGSYVTHPSSTTPGQVLKDHFSAKWAQEGTRPCKDHHKPRFICGFTEHGPANFLHQVGIDFREAKVRNSCMWFTEAPPGMPHYLAGIQPWHHSRPEDHPLPHSHGI